MSAANEPGGRLSIWRAAYVVARRDFTAILVSRYFIFFLLGPLLPILFGGLAGGIGKQVAEQTAPPEIGVAMQAEDVDRMLAAYDRLASRLGPALPPMVELKRLAPGESFDARAVLNTRGGNMAAVLTGTPAAPVLTATKERLGWWDGSVALVAATALERTPATFPTVKHSEVATSGANETRGRMVTAQAAQTLLFMVIVFLSGMVLSTLVEEKANKIIEVLAAAIPMEAVFLGKLFAMMAVSLVGVAIWGTVISSLIGLAGMNGSMLGGIDLSNLPTPAVGWPLFLVLSVAYFTTGYLLLGAIFLAIGSMAKTVREVQTLSMPVTMFQVLVLLFCFYARTQPGKPMELAAIIFPLSSPMAMIARAATDEAVWPHVAALAWQVFAVGVFIKLGSGLFRRRVMQSGPQHRKQRRGLLAIIKGKQPA